MTEDELLHAITDLCDTYDPPVRWIHLRDARREGGPWRTGLPDLFLLCTRGCMWRELKGPGGRTRGTQNRWLFWLREAGQDSRVWQPRDWDSGTIATELAALNGQDAVVSDEPDPEKTFYRALYGPRR